MATNKVNGKVFTILGSVARTATPTIDDFILPEQPGERAGGLIVVIDVTAIAATPSVVFDIVAVDQLSGKSPILLSSAAITATGTTLLQIGPGMLAVANLVADSNVPPVVSVIATHADADSITYTVAGMVC
jgi:hypothetical protein